jgi:DNA-binding LacI/PurR family transcriptional regulator
VGTTPRKPATLWDVAAMAGVSHQTVSRVINDHANVAPGTRERVLRAVEELAYLPNVAARNLVTRRSLTVGIASYGNTFYGPSQMLTHIETSFRERGYALTLSTMPAFTPDGLASAMQDLRARSVDGIVMITPLLDTDLDTVRSVCNGVPFVMIDIDLGAEAPSVVIDQRHGGALAAEHLIRLGHERIAVIRGPSDWTGSALRHAGFSDTLARHGIEPVLSAAGDWSPASGYRVTVALLQERTPFSALVVANDEMALGALRALHEHGVRVPEDVSVIGFDDTPGSAYFEPPLTTIRQDFAALGTDAADYLIQLMSNPDHPPEQRVLEPRLVVRESTGRAGSLVARLRAPEHDGPSGD